jgi:hypothetical protein
MEHGDLFVCSIPQKRIVRILVDLAVLWFIIKKTCFFYHKKQNKKVCETFKRKRHQHFLLEITHPDLLPLNVKDTYDLSLSLIISWSLYHCIMISLSYFSCIKYT